MFDLAQSDTDELLVMRVGTIASPEKSAKYRRLSREKAERLIRMFAEYGHVTSLQSANPDLDQYPGAIKVGHYVFSFSGLPSDWDEVFSLTAAAMWLRNPELFDELKALAKRTGNEVRFVIMMDIYKHNRRDD